MAPYLMFAAIVLIPVGCLILAGVLFANLYPRKKQIQAHNEALVYLGDVIRAAADRAPDPSAIRDRVSAVLEFLEYPDRGDIADWESTMTSLLYPTDNDPTEPWDKVLAEYFEFARAYLYSDFVKHYNISAYERVRACLADVGVQAKPVEELALGRL